MRHLLTSFFSLLILFSIHSSALANSKDPALISAMQNGGHILMLRHAKAPGFGDPDTIKISDCSTQRNLDDEGRRQSSEIGNWLRKNNIEASAVYSSQWCRCLDTARLLKMGEVKELPSLNSFFQMPQNRDASLKSLKQFIAKQNIRQKLIIMVTHSVTISAVSGQSVDSGDGVLLKLNDSAPYEFVGVVSNMGN